ncbi:unnamed protein product [Closterium sp. Naga37s-1]|nr:unnamed protein product [Closterium sp. Naga37s-1]
MVLPLPQSHYTLRTLHPSSCPRLASPSPHLHSSPISLLLTRPKSFQLTPRYLHCPIPTLIPPSPPPYHLLLYPPVPLSLSTSPHNGVPKYARFTVRTYARFTVRMFQGVIESVVRTSPITSLPPSSPLPPPFLSITPFPPSPIPPGTRASRYARFTVRMFQGVIESVVRTSPITPHAVTNAADSDGGSDASAADGAAGGDSDAAAASGRAVHVIDGTDKMLLPGMVNAHTHSIEAWGRGGIVPLGGRSILSHEPTHSEVPLEALSLLGLFSTLM